MLNSIWVMHMVKAMVSLSIRLKPLNGTHRLAVAQGLASAQCNLGCAYANGEGVSVDLMVQTRC